MFFSHMYCTWNEAVTPGQEKLSVTIDQSFSIVIKEIIRIFIFYFEFMLISSTRCLEISEETMLRDDIQK